MATVLFSQYRGQNLKAFIDLLKRDYYDTIALNCCNIDKLINTLQQEEQSLPDRVYIDLCATLAEEIKQNVHMCEVIVIPYVYELHEKLSTDHNCANCSGKCNVHHNLQLRGVQAAHMKMKNLLRRTGAMLQVESAPQETTGNTQVLRNEIVCLDTILTELIHLEEAILIPRIVEAQTGINAFS